MILYDIFIYGLCFYKIENLVIKYGKIIKIMNKGYILRKKQNIKKGLIRSNPLKMAGLNKLYFFVTGQ